LFFLKLVGFRKKEENLRFVMFERSEKSLKE